MRVTMNSSRLKRLVFAVVPKLRMQRCWETIRILRDRIESRLNFILIFQTAEKVLLHTGSRLIYYGARHKRHTC